MIKEQVITNRGGVFDAENIITGWGFYRRL